MGSYRVQVFAELPHNFTCLKFPLYSVVCSQLVKCDKHAVVAMCIGCK